jgi:hypothetical protein
VLEEALVATPRKLDRILVHEVFHLVWVRLGNGTRGGWAEVLGREVRAGERGELGWSSERLKERLSRRDREGNSRLWREYACESFCDTAGWLYSRAGFYAERTLGGGAREARREWFAAELARRGCWRV